MRLRSILETTVGDLDAALASAADALLLSLTAPGPERGEVRAAVTRVREAGKAALVVVNHPRTRLLRDDLDALVGEGLDGVLLPHATEPQDVRDLAVLLREFEYTRGMEPGVIAAFPVIDSARGVLRAGEIAGAAPRVAGLVFDTAGYARDTGARYEEEGPRLAYARGAVVAAAVAHEALPLVRGEGFDMVQLAHYGFAGGIVPNRARLTAANAAYTPTEAGLERARAMVAAYDAARAEGAWVGRLEGSAVDGHAVRRARRLIDSAE